MNNHTARHARRAILLAATGTLLAVPASAQWETVWSDTSSVHDFSYRSIDTLTTGATPNRTFVVAGGSHSETTAPNSRYSDLSIWDSYGNQVWLNRVTCALAPAGSTILDFHSVKQLSNGDFLVAGYAEPSPGSRTNFIMRMANFATPLWAYGTSWTVSDDTNIEALELSSGNLAMIDTIDMGNGATTRVTFMSANGNGISSRALGTADGANIILRDIQEDPSTGLLYGAGYHYYNLAFNITACIVAIDPALPVANQFVGIWTYHDPAHTDSSFNAIDIVTGSTHQIYAAGSVSTLTFPGTNSNFRVVRINNPTLASMAPTDDYRFPFQLVPAKGGIRRVDVSTCNAGLAWYAHPQLVHVAGTTNSGHSARLVTLSGTGAPAFVSAASYGGGTPPLTSFAGMAIVPDSTRHPVMVGSHRLNGLATSEYEPYVVRPGCDLKTPCSIPFTATHTLVSTAMAAPARAYLPVSISSGGTGSIPVTRSYNVGLGFPTVQVTLRGECAGCRPDLTGSATAGSPGYGVPNGTLNSEDYFFFLAQYAAGNLAITDLTTTAVAGSPGYGIPNGVLDSEDFFFYLSLYGQGC